MATEYKSVEYQIHECLVQMQEILTVLDFDEILLESIQECKELIKNKQYTIAVMGEFKRGKSSLINALLGSKILPADATPTTATINRITYGTTPKVIITFCDGKNKEISIDELADYVTKTTTNGEARALKIKEATIFFPTVFCQNHIDIIDTPGLNDEARMTRITINMIANVDAVIVPIHARAPFSETEKNFVCQLIESDSINNLVFVVTFLDQLDEDDYDYDRFMEYLRHRIQTEVFSELEKRDCSIDTIQKAHRLLDQLQISGVSSSQALESFVSNNRELRKKSRFEPFHDMLLGVVTSQQMENAIRKTIDTLRFVVSEFDGQNQKRKTFWDNSFQQLERNLEKLQEYCAESPRVLNFAFARNSDFLQNKIRSFNTNKNYIVEEFIHILSQVRQNEHEMILAALNRAAQIVNQEIHQQCQTLQKDIIDILLSFLPPIQENEQKSLDFLIEFPKTSKYIRFEKKAQEMETFAKKIFNNAVCFNAASYIPRAVDLTHFNIIEHVIKEVDLSVARYIEEVNQIVDTIQKNWGYQFNTHLEELSSCAMEDLMNKQETQDFYYKAYVRNYQMFHHNSQEILQRCESLWKEFERGGE